MTVAAEPNGAPLVHPGRYGTLTVQQSPVAGSIQWGMRLRPFFYLTPTVTVSAFISIDGAVHSYSPHIVPPEYHFHGSYGKIPPRAVVVFMFQITPVTPVVSEQGPGSFFFQWWSCRCN